MSKLIGPIQSIVILNQSLLGLGSGAAALFQKVVHKRVECGHLPQGAGPGPTPDDLSRQAAARGG